MLFPDALRTFKKHQSEERLKPFTIDTQISHRFLCLKSPFLRFFFISLPPLPLRKQKLQLLYFRFSFLGYSAVQYLCWKGSIRFRFRYRRYSTKDIWHLPPLPTHLQEDPLSHVRVKSYHIISGVMFIYRTKHLRSLKRYNNESQIYKTQLNNIPIVMKQRT